MLSLIMVSCDDGNIIDVSLEFNQDLDRCVTSNSSGEEFYLLYDTKTNPNESLSLLFRVSSNRDIFNPESNGAIKILTVGQSGTRFNYRTYNGDPDALICVPVPDNVTIINDYEAAAGAEAIFTSTFVDDDNDGIPSLLEGIGLQAEDGSYPDAQDTDGDGLPDYLDADDDGDNVLTINEDVEIDENGLLIALDTDGNTVPNYLDNDDDGDGVLTKDEDENGDLILTNDFDELQEITFAIPRYLNIDADMPFPQDSLRLTEFSRQVTVGVVINNADIEILNVDEIIMGIYEAPTLTFRFNPNTEELELLEN